MPLPLEGWSYDGENVRRPNGEVFVACDATLNPEAAAKLSAIGSIRSASYDAPTNTLTIDGVDYVLKGEDDRPEYAEVLQAIMDRHGWNAATARKFARSVADVVLAMKAHGRI